MNDAELNPAFDANLLSRIEDAGLNASAPPQQRWLDGWLVRVSPGKAKRARCVNAVAAGRLPVEERLSACAQVFDEAKLPLIVRITPFSLPAGLDALLDSQGLRRFDDTRVMALADLSAFDVPPSASDATIQSIGLEAFAQRVGGFRGSPLAQRQAHAERLLNSPVPFFAFELRANGEPVACGQFALEGDLVGLYDVFTAESARGRGLAGRLCRHLLTQARSRGARHAYLQVEGDNHAARAVYHRLGLADAYAYHYRARDPSAA
ncbi:MAG: GNAT family N-acetyltransferase [Burkholderiales bacterium]